MFLFFSRFLHVCLLWPLFQGLLAIFRDPTNPFTILEPQDLEIDEVDVIRDRLATDFQVTKL